MTKTTFTRASGVLAVLLIGAVTGCSNARFNSVGPSVRSFNEDGGLAEQYVGFDLDFTLEQDTPHVPGLQRDTMH